MCVCVLSVLVPAYVNIRCPALPCPASNIFDWQVETMENMTKTPEEVRTRLDTGRVNADPNAVGSTLYLLIPYFVAVAPPFLSQKGSVPRSIYIVYPSRNSLTLTGHNSRSQIYDFIDSNLAGVSLYTHPPTHTHTYHILRISSPSSDLGSPPRIRKGENRDQHRCTSPSRNYGETKSNLGINRDPGSSKG